MTYYSRDNVIRHRDGSISTKLTEEERAMLWRLVREGRRYIIATEPEFDSSFALDFMRAIEHRS